ncbi:aminotransferase class I/II-fold pyridoxal phosphate-dependent enzyme [Garciella nitratireducens]|uniref:Lysine decarboxylase n=1 Tax=Garciella nitratireducens DSM 15102 TaxID=1121911 RepID=A0A1T4P6M4_9FIRM|nr:aminotransferase class V-fold PLP-dependent enzyme [Garciella nitratireducens]SJZ87240.1 lysine decarboxylase [Garciella nitratireducens DSM 15102]
MSLIEGLNKILQENLTRLHMPGHKGRKIFPEILKNNLQEIDITEIPGSDNLHHAQEILLEAQQRAAKVFGAQKTYFLINGTTVGIQAMILATCRPGDKLLVPRNCHRSVFSALILGDIIPVYLSPISHPKTGIDLSISVEEIEKKLKQHPDVKGAVLTYPTYYGSCSDIEKIAKILHHKKKFLLVDEAHGAHLALHKNLPLSALQAGADIVVDSTHKILSSFTQSAMLHIGNQYLSTEKVELFLGMLQSSSPSYLLMASLDWASQQAEEMGQIKWEKIIQWTHQAREDIRHHTNMKPIGNEIIGRYHVVDYDPSKLLIDVSSTGLTGIETEKILREKYRIQVELSDYYHILAMTGMGTIEQDIQRFTQAMIDIDHKYGNPHKKLTSLPIRIREGEMGLSPRKAIYAPSEKILLKNAQGRMSKEFIIPYPPGIPMVLPGEVITQEIIEEIEIMQRWGGTIIGLEDNTLQNIQVIK